MSLDRNSESLDRTSDLRTEAPRFAIRAIEDSSRPVVPSCDAISAATEQLEVNKTYRKSCPGAIKLVNSNHRLGGPSVNHP
jgi:hypothetical protein